MTPLMVHVPEIAPISKRMTMAVVTLPMLLEIAFSKSFQGVLKSHMDSQIQTPAAVSRATWLAPRIESLPKMLTSRASKTMRTRMGIRDMRIRVRERGFMQCSFYSRLQRYANNPVY